MSGDETKSTSDEIDWKCIDQLHQATLQISSGCLEYKKLCVTVLAAVSAIMIRINDGQFNNDIFIIGLLVCAGFWLSDATAYYFQRSLRVIMEAKLKLIADRNSLEYTYVPISRSAYKAMFNPSMTLYYALIAIISIMWWLAPMVEQPI